MKAVTISSNQLALWNELPVVPRETGASLLFAQGVNDEGQVTSQSMRMLPVTAGKDKDGVQKDCLAVRTGLKGEELKVRANQESIKVKDYLLQVMIEASKSNAIGGVGLKITAGGRLNLVLKRLTPQVAMLSDAELAQQLGCPVEKVTEMRKASGKSVNQVVELKPAPQNGTPELIPAAKPATAPVAPGSPGAPVANPQPKPVQPAGNPQNAR